MAIYQSMTDLELLDLLGKSDENAFREIYYRYWKVVFTNAKKKLDDFQDAEDLVNELFVSIWKRRTHMPEIQSLTNYFKGAVRNQVLKYWGMKYKAESYILEQQNKFYVQESVLQNDLEYKELELEVNKAISSLPEKCRLVFELSRVEGLSQQQIAAKLGISLKTVEAHISKALKILKIKLGKYFLIFFL
ncbi:hypothetical protein ASE74_04480 [Pedobacter sp. Leaf216]|uniref:RNA polymerase sigma-70 factor n=1 Tax=Pedobacter sp. Leaf216 TaxID=1735684 RepID=UPI000713068E|nr:RNA polymerase sigma-70 factor [Pedobacter sp. Leaf216]KQM69276.1 hypothetical protein ASE74_04480 [Pedobacter sp. Leaf216]